MGSALRVLMVDDDVLRQRAIKRIFRVRRREVEWVCEVEGAAAIAALERSRFDRLLLDVHLADDVSGIEVLSFARGKRMCTPAIIYSGDLDQATSLAAQRLGACPLPFDAATRQLVDALVDPPFSAYGAVADGSDLSLHDRFKDLKLSYFARVLEERGGNIRSAARALHISQQAAQYLVKLLRDREDDRRTG